MSSISTQPRWKPPPPPPGPRLVVYNSLTKSKVPFEPREKNYVSWYSCGPTVYDASHMGHARNYVTQDIIRRILRDYFGYDVHYCMNITDIDDKIIIRARRTHLVSEEKRKNPILTEELLSQTKAAWREFLLVQFFSGGKRTPPSDDVFQDGNTARNILDQLSTETLDPTSEMHLKSLKNALQTITQAESSLSDTSKEPESSSSLFDACSDIMGAYLDSKFKTLVTDRGIFRELASKQEADFMADMASLGVEPPTTLTRVSEFVHEIVEFVQVLVDKGFAYKSESGNVWFDVKKFDGAPEHQSQGLHHFYAKLSPHSKGNKKLSEEGDGNLTDWGEKRSDSDFALWKTSKPGEPAWDGLDGKKGRPGWHIECSVMASHVFGSQIDIHSGGIDLAFPHHDNELAQSEAYHGCDQWVNYFLHTGHLHIKGLKMSKSLKNFITIKEALEKYSSRQLRLAFLSQLWSSTVDFKDDTLIAAKADETTFSNFFADVKALLAETQTSFKRHGGAETTLLDELKLSQEAFRAALCDSFNTPRALQELSKLVSAANIYRNGRPRKDLDMTVLRAIATWVSRMVRMFGLGGESQEIIGWGDQTNSGDQSQLIPTYTAISAFRDEVRRLARGKASQEDAKKLSVELLRLCDRFRDEDCVNLGVALDDQEDGKALVKLVPAETLLAARREKQAEADRKKKEDAAKSADAKARESEKLEMGRIPPSELFRNDEQFSAWDEEGLPTLDRDGVELSKSRRKTLSKAMTNQTRLHKKWLASQNVAD